MTEWVQPEHREIHNLLINWGRWAISHASRGHCASIEHRYRSPQCWNDPQPKTEHDEQLAFLIEQSMRIVPKLSRKLLKLKYVVRCDKEFIARRLRLKDYDQALYTARQIALNLARAQLVPGRYGRFPGVRLSDMLCRTT